MEINDSLNLVSHSSKLLNWGVVGTPNFVAKLDRSVSTLGTCLLGTGI